MSVVARSRWTRARWTRASIGNAALLLALSVAVVMLLAWHWPNLNWNNPPRQRWWQAGAVVLTWLLGCLWLRRQHAGVQARHARFEPASACDDMQPDWWVLHASQTGQAEQLAWQTAATLSAAGASVQVRPLGAIGQTLLPRAAKVLFLASTTGEGDAPDGTGDALPEPTDAASRWTGLRYGVLALGDRRYQHFCGFGRYLDQRMRELGATALFDTVEVDNGDPDALRLWQHRLSIQLGHSELPDWQAPNYQPWRLTERRLLNPGCEGGACFHLSLEACDPAHAAWQAGDIAVIGPRNAPREVAALLDALGLAAASTITTAGSSDAEETLGMLLSRCHLPDPVAVAGLSANQLAATLQPLPHREYSIASLPSDGGLHLLLRQLRRPDGRPGIGAGWLTAHAPLGAIVDLRIRRNPNFHLPAGDGPLILVGNGTGIAGLRALLKARVAAKQRDNWLLFGERHAACDAYYQDDLQAWHAEGFLTRVDRVYSRDSSRAMYVQDRLRERGDQLRAWVTAGAAIYVCGSQQGMASGVHDALRDLLGAQSLQDLTSAGRYRRDVY